jgi:rSAM/selenodomain-associated transferase 2
MVCGAMPRDIPTLSIVMPVLDEAAGIVPVLQALAPLRLAGAELIVVDGGSRDATVALAAPWCDRLLQPGAQGRGRARQMNAGAAAARAPVLLFLHADTRLPQSADALVAAALARGASWGRFDVRILGRSRLLPAVGALMNLRSRLTGIATGDQALFVRRALFEQVGGYPDQPLMEDVELSKRLCRSGRPACVSARALTSGRRWDRHGALRTIVLMWTLRWRYWRGTPAEVLARVWR